MIRPLTLTLACLLGLGSAARADDGLKMVPADAAGFVHVRVADLWASPAMAEMRKLLELAGEDAIKTFEERFEPSPSQVESVTAFMVMAPGGREPMPLGVVTFKSEIDRDAFDRTTRRELDSGVVGLKFLNPKTLLIGPPPVVEKYTAEARTADGPLAPALKAAAGQHFTLAVNFAAIPAEAFEEIPPPFRPLFKAKLATVSLNVGKNIDAALRLNYATEREASDAEQSVKVAVEMAKQQMEEARPDMLKMLRGDPSEYPSPIGEMPEAIGGLLGLGMMNQLNKWLDELPLKREGTGLSLAASVDSGQYTPLLAVSATSAALLLPAVQKVRGAASRMKSSNNLKQMALSIHTYDSAYGHIPAAAITDKDGKPLLSWRVAILPYLEQENLYRQFRLDEPWDSEHNKKLIPLMPQIYVLPDAPPNAEWKTHYRVFVGNPAAEPGVTLQTAFDMKTGRKILFPDGTSNTAMIVEAAEPVVWTKPEPLVIEPGKPLPKLGDFFDGGANIAFGDGSVRFFRVPIEESTFRAMLSIDGGEVIDWPDQ